MIKYRHFDYEIWYIKHCTEELRGIRELLPRSRNKITAVRKEMEILRATVHLLHGQTDNSLTRIDRLFMDTDPKEGVGKTAVHVTFDTFVSPYICCFSQRGM